MLTNVHVKNLALIEETEVEFAEGFNVLTGETGAGKSIIIGSINYCLGQKADKDVIRNGAEYALVELVFQVEDKNDIDLIKKMDIPVEDDGVLILSRKIMPQRSIFKVCGETVTAKQMKELAEILIDIHGQHEHQSLLSEKKQARILDEYAGDKLNKVKEELSDLYKEYLSVKESISNFSMDDMQREREISLAQFEVDEIEDACLIDGEDERLNKEYRLMLNSRKIAESLNKTLMYIDGDDTSALSLVGYAARELSSVNDLDEKGEEISSRLLDIEGLLNDLYRDANSYLEGLDFSEMDFKYTEDRLNVINHLTMKYGGSVEKVNEYLEQRKTELEKLLKIDETRNDLEKRLNELTDKILLLCKKAHDYRVKEAEKLSEEITLVLEDLNFLKVQFEITVEKRDSFNSEGYDDITFMISLNPGEKMKPISMVASGGELSRIMLALKTVFADNDNIDTLIFDEIDTGISGKTAWKVSERMGLISLKHQIICITHLPQIAAMADRHFLIEKSEKAGKTVTNLTVLSEDERVDELSRMLGSDDISDAVRANAIELINRANKVKK